MITSPVFAKSFSEIAAETNWPEDEVRNAYYTGMAKIKARSRTLEIFKGLVELRTRECFRENRYDEMERM